MRRLHHILLPIAMLAVTSTFANAATVIIQNHSFETPDVAPSTFTSGVIPNWTETGSGQFGVFNAGDFGQGAAAPDGSQVAFFETNGTLTVSQTLTDVFTVGNDYTLSLDIAKRTATPGATSSMNIFLYHSGNTANVVKSISVNGTNLTADVFQTFGFTATAAEISSASATGQSIGIGFRSTGTVNGPFDLDFVRLNSIPEPATSLLGGLGVLLLLRRRRCE